MSQQPFNSDGGFSTISNIFSGNITVTVSHDNLVFGDAEIAQNYNYYRSRFGV
jgi:hypothetical protein